MIRSALFRAVSLALAGSLTLFEIASTTVAAGSLDPITERGRSISRLFLASVIVGGLIFLVVVGALAYILLRFRSRPDAGPTHALSHPGRFQIIWVGGMVLVFAIFAGFALRTMNIVSAPAGDNALNVQVIGHQWWWEFRYPDSNVVTANEFRLPVNTPVHFEILSDDVIHSFWMPDFGWKMDAIPGKQNSIAVEVDREGTFDGACAEYCGAQHAWMRIQLVVQPADQFRNWIEQQQQPVTSPNSVVERQGLDVFLTNSCVSCHSVGFAEFPLESSNVGPDLTHVGSRETIGGGVVPNTPENMAVWIRNAGDVKPHVLMPPFESLTDDQIQALVAFLEGLD